MKRRAVILGVIVVAAVAAGLAFYWPFGNGAETLRLPGIVETQEIRLGSKIGGRVAEVKVREGDLVEAGQVLVRFEMPEMEAQRLQAQSRLEAAWAELNKAVYGPREEEKEAGLAAAKAAEARWKRLEAGW